MTHTHRRARTHTRTHAHTHTRTHARARAHTHTQTHAPTHARAHEALHASPALPRPGFTPDFTPDFMSDFTPDSHDAAVCPLEPPPPPLAPAFAHGRRSNGRVGSSWSNGGPARLTCSGRSSRIAVAPLFRSIWPGPAVRRPTLGGARRRPPAFTPDFSPASSAGGRVCPRHHQPAKPTRLKQEFDRRALGAAAHPPPLGGHQRARGGGLSAGRGRYTAGV